MGQRLERAVAALQVDAQLVQDGAAHLAQAYDEDLEAAVLQLEPRSRARLAERLLESLDNLTPEENAQIWGEEAQRRDDALNAGTLTSRPADQVFRDARTRL